MPPLNGAPSHLVVTGEGGAPLARRLSALGDIDVTQLSGARGPGMRATAARRLIWRGAPDWAGYPRYLATRQAHPGARLTFLEDDVRARALPEDSAAMAAFAALADTVVVASRARAAAYAAAGAPDATVVRPAGETEPFFAAPPPRRSGPLRIGLLADGARPSEAFKVIAAVAALKPTQIRLTVFADAPQAALAIAMRELGATTRAWSDEPESLREIDLIAAPCEAGAFDPRIAQARAAGRAVLAAAAQGVGEQVAEGGYVAPNGADAGAWATAIERLSLRDLNRDSDLARWAVETDAARFAAFWRGALVSQTTAQSRVA